jgi:hypothetical protein
LNPAKAPSGGFDSIAADIGVAGVTMEVAEAVGLGGRAAGSFEVSTVALFLNIRM